MDVKKTQSFIEMIQLSLRLHMWNIYVAEETADDDCNASIHFTPGRRYATIRFAEDWDERSPEDKRHDVVHELLHVFHNDVDDNLWRFIDESGDLSDYVKSILLSQTRTDLERMVDSLTNVIAPLMPEWE